MRKIIIVTISVVLLLMILIFINSIKNSKQYLEGLEITYKGKEKIILKNKLIEKEIKIKNTTEQVKIYTLYLNEKENSFKNKNEIKYSVTSDDKEVKNIKTLNITEDTHQIIGKVKIAPKATQTYKLKIWYDGNEQEEKQFIGTLKIVLESEEENTEQIEIVPHPMEEQEKIDSITNVEGSVG